MSASAGRLAASRQRPRVDLIFFDAGGGHRASAIALKAVAERQRCGWDIRLLNLRDLLGPIDFTLSSHITRIFVRPVGVQRSETESSTSRCFSATCST